MKKIILSFDYELFFGDRSGTVKKTLIEPTDLLMDALEKNGLRGNFFIDYLMFRALEKDIDDERVASDLTLLKQQVRDMVRRGHRIELHLHPHWIDARYNGDGTWNFENFTHYSLISLGKDVVTSMFKEGVAYLKLLIYDVAPNYKVCAFRAGGWAVQPFSHICDGLRATGISIDSSSCYGTYEHHDYSQFDFREIPHKAIYKFQDDLNVECHKGEFIEIPISSYRRLLMYKGLDWISKRYSTVMTRMTDGSHGRKTEKMQNRRPHLFNYCMLTMSISTFSCVLLSIFSIKPLLVYIDHPKDLHLATLKTIKVLSKFCDSKFYYDYLSS